MNIRITLLLACAGFILTYFGITYFVTRHLSVGQNELKWYTKNLGYSFCGEVISIELLHNKWGYGYVTCRSTGNITEASLLVEDSLGLLLKDHSQLRFLKSQGEDYRFLIQGADFWKKGNVDSICVDSDNDEIILYHKNEIVSTQKVSGNLDDGRF